jgi:hypothetical protein
MERSSEMSKRFALSIGLFVCLCFLFSSNVFALSFSGQSYDVGSQPDSVVVDDFNGDGKPDLAVANRGSNTVSILLGNGDGTFKAAVNYSVSSPQSIATDDFDRDGNKDLAVARGSDNGISILFGNADGTFSNAVNYSVNSPQYIAVGDFDRDGNKDLAVARGSNNGISILFGNADGTFSNAVNYITGTNTSSVTVRDFNKDGILDLAAANKGGNTVSILLGNGDGTFDLLVNYGVNSPQSVAAYDFNIDGDYDLVLSNSSGNTVSILLGNGDGSFNSAVTYIAGDNPYSVAVSDFDTDGKLDLAVANSGSNTVSVLLGKGDGTFAKASDGDYDVGKSPLSVAVDDFNSDGKPDLAVANSGSNTVSVLLNTTSSITVPGAPTGVKATAGDMSATVSFSAPASDGGSPITSYTVTASPGSITATGASSPIIVQGLTNGTSYKFTVTAANAIGTSPESAPSNKIIPGPMISVGPMSVNFGPVRVGSTSAPKTVTIKSKGNADLIIDSVSVTGANQSDFIQTNSCATITPKGSCPITVTFVPSLPFGKETAILSVFSNDPNKPTVTVKLLGQAAPPKISVAPGSVHFPGTEVNNISAPKIVRIKNTGKSDLIIDSITVADAPEFVQTNDCSTLAKGSSCTVSLTFVPTSIGKKNGTLVISSNDPNKPTVNVHLSGKGKT